MNFIIGSMFFSAVVWVIIGHSMYKAPSDKELWGTDLD